jgi:peptide/nickel transport system permease protein
VSDTAITRLVDIVLAMPILLFAIGIATVCGITAEGCLGGLLQPGLSLVIGVIALFTWPNIARIVRGQVLSLREREFIEAARSLGASTRRIMFKELLPNLAAPIIVYSTLMIPANILFEAYLSYLGVGVPQTTPSWGRMLSDATEGQLPGCVPTAHDPLLQPRGRRAARRAESGARMSESARLRRKEVLRKPLCMV